MAGLGKQKLANLKRNNRVAFAALSRPCVDCNITWHPLVMTFDHVDRAEKKHVLADFRTAAPHEFDAELAKCEAVCRNCHQIREYLRDIDVLKVSAIKRNKYKYYERLVPYLAGGAIIRRDAFDLVPIGDS